LEDIGSDYGHFDSSYLFVRDINEGGENAMEESTHSRINVWLISDPEMCAMIPKVLKPEDLEYTYSIVMPDMEQPWDIMAQCEKWMKSLKDAIYMISPLVELQTLEMLKERIVDLCKTYQEPEFDKDGKFIPAKIKKKMQH